MVQLSHPYMTTGKTIALTRRTFVGKVMSLLFNMLSRMVITFLPRSKHLLNFMAAVTICSDFGALKIKPVTVSIVSPSICHEVMGLAAMILVYWMKKMEILCPHSRSLLTHASVGDPQTLKGRSGSVSCEGHCSIPLVLVHLYCCPAIRLISTTFLDSICMH